MVLILILLEYCTDVKESRIYSDLLSVLILILLEYCTDGLNMASSQITRKS